MVYLLLFSFYIDVLTLYKYYKSNIFQMDRKMAFRIWSEGLRIEIQERQANLGQYIVQRKTAMVIFLLCLAGSRTGTKLMQMGKIK